MTPIVAARDAEHRAVVAQVDLSAAAEVAAAAGYGRVERHALTGREAPDAGPYSFDDARRLVPHHQRRNTPAGRSVVAMD
ncbi:MAG TPA: hypothetical protein VKE96_30055, partial [Vicinamibacterales bacterium]|nr:hypothetical protein [Vicinamibacterales bacterium]